MKREIRDGIKRVMKQMRISSRVCVGSLVSSCQNLKNNWDQNNEKSNLMQGTKKEKEKITPKRSIWRNTEEIWVIVFLFFGCNRVPPLNFLKARTTRVLTRETEQQV